MRRLTFKVDEDYLERLDLYLSNELEDISRSQIKNLIKEKLVIVNGRIEKPSYPVREDDIIEVNIPREEKLELVAENLGLEIIYEDDYICVVNKKKGMVVHPAPGHERATLVNGLLYQVDKLSTINGEFRPGIVHRLDKDTSGILLVAKTNDAHENLAKQFKDRSVVRKYNTLVHGVISEKEGLIDAPIGRHPINRQRMAVTKENSRQAISKYRVLENFDKYTFLEVELKTGRTHQIRVHMNYINYPIVGDQTYSSGRNEFALKDQFLHARELSFIHPATNKQVSFKAELPDENKKILEGLINRRDSRCL